MNPDAITARYCVELFCFTMFNLTLLFCYDLVISFSQHYCTVGERRHRHDNGEGASSDRILAQYSIEAAAQRPQLSQ